MSKKIKKRIRLKYKKERVVLSDILPFETPITFSNRHFYNFLISNKIELRKSKNNNNFEIYWRNNDDEFIKILELLFNVKIDKNSIQYFIDKITKIEICKYKLKENSLITIPYSFKISHKENNYRQLSIIHPINQLSLIEFYDKYKYSILYYSSLSPFSIRRPYKIAKFIFVKDEKHKRKKVEEPNQEIIEEFNKEYENLKSFFVYKHYSNIYKFYESYIYQRNEKRFDKLFKFDLNKFFDSIYTHSIAWAIHKKDIIKKYLKQSELTFGGQFDYIMQKLNYNETNGIIIGPEFSRIFAELILQSIDFEVFKILESKNIKLKIDYNLFRYVDDFFLFYDKEEIRKNVLETYIHKLNEFKLSINEDKSIIYEKPLITDLTIAKNKISKLFDNLLKYEFETENKIIKKLRFNLNANKGITKFKMIVKESNIEYRDILNYSLNIIDRKISKILQNFDKLIFDNSKLKDKFTNFLVEVIEFIMFVYAVSPRVSLTIKVSSILSKIIKYVKYKKDQTISFFNNDQKNLIFKKIYDEISFILTKNKLREYTQIESLYLLIILESLGKHYRLDQEKLADYFSIDLQNKKFYFKLEYWSITVLLFYMKNLKRYNKLKEILKEHIKVKLQDYDDVTKYTEAVLLIFDLLSCPYLDFKFKKSILTILNITKNKEKLIKKIESYKNWFTNWYNFDLEKELNTKKSKEVY